MSVDRVFLTVGNDLQRAIQVGSVNFNAGVFIKVQRFRVRVLHSVKVAARKHNGIWTFCFYKEFRIRKPATVMRVRIQTAVTVFLSCYLSCFLLNGVGKIWQESM